MALICPHCEKPLDEHDENACRRRMSRRFFFGLIVAPVLARAIAPVIGESLVAPIQITAAPIQIILSPDPFEIPKWYLDYITEETLRRLRDESLALRDYWAEPSFHFPVKFPGTHPSARLESGR